MSARVVVDRSNPYPLTLEATPTFCCGLFVTIQPFTNRYGDDVWRSNFFFKSRRDALKHARHFSTFAVGRVVNTVRAQSGAQS